MSSRLETVPRDILQHIAFLCASSSVFDPPVELLRLLQTSSTIYRSLNVHAAPDLYAHVFSTKFDTLAPLRRYGVTLTDSALATELLNRCRLLRRSHRSDFSDPGLMHDLWTALWMLLESDGLNEHQLSAVNFTDFILKVARAVFGDPTIDHRTDSQILKHIVVWLLCISLPRRKPSVNLDPSTSSPVTAPQSFSSCSVDLDGDAHAVDGDSSYLHGSSTPASNAHVSGYLKCSRPTVPYPSIAAINLAFVIYEATPMKVPYHLPETRAIANASQRSGPTQEDYRAVASYQTPLFADSLPTGTKEQLTSPTSLNPTRSMLHDVQFRDVLKTSDSAAGPDAFHYIPGTMSGVWEGVYRTVNAPIKSETSPSHHNPLVSRVFIKPMQCALTEYICMRSDGQQPPHETDILADEKISSDFLDASRYVAQTEPVQRQAERINSLYDVILLGETLDDHNQAWGGYRFSGRIQKDGIVRLKREAVRPPGHQAEGLWLFEGHFQSRDVVLGRWRITGAPDGDLDHGIFSLGRSLEKWND
ncbi:hypothetical protein BDZ97DRAFT_1652248 [Flammula alnicola]|nr:hypothetical protein BDZ97DRAFT_1652248 [Flammula alnicola]